MSGYLVRKRYCVIFIKVRLHCSYSSYRRSLLSVLLEATAKLTLLRSVPKYMQKPTNPTVTRYPLSFGLVGGAVQCSAVSCNPVFCYEVFHLRHRSQYIENA